MQWLYIIRLFLRVLRIRGHPVRRWWVKPHIVEAVRNVFGAYEALFRYYMESDHEEFYKMTRMKPCAFEELHDLVEPYLRKFSLRRPLPTRLRLALVLNFLANGDSVTTTKNFFRIGRSTTYSIFAEVCPIIWKVLSPIVLRNRSERDFKIIAGGFRTRWNMPNCVGAIDGQEIRIKAPPNSGSQFFNYKKFFSVKMLAACDAYYRFIWVDIGDYGSVSDISFFYQTDFYAALENGEANLPPACRLPRSSIVLPHFFVGDEIFTQQMYMMVPFARRYHLTDRQRNYSYRISRARNCIEDAFGILCSMWQILHKDLAFKLKTSIAIMQAVVCLHNFVLNKKMEREDIKKFVPKKRYRKNCTEGLRDLLRVPNEEDIIANNRHEARELLADYLQSEAGAISF